jgi:flagellar secretion chaperone FliS
MSINTYEENRILSASPIELVKILYTAANRAVQNARQHLSAGDIAARSKEITKAQEILLELGSSVDASKAPEFSERLLALYDYMQSRLTEANAQQKDSPLAEVISLLETLQDAWSQCSSSQQLELAAAGR